MCSLLNCFPHFVECCHPNAEGSPQVKNNDTNCRISAQCSGKKVNLAKIVPYSIDSP